jgi:hypothetical protein
MYWRDKKTRRPGPVLASVKPRRRSHGPPELDKGYYVAYYALCATGGAIGGGAARAATSTKRATGLASISPLAHGAEQGDGSASVRAAAFDTRDRFVSLAEAAQNLKPAFTVVAIVFVERHIMLLTKHNRWPPLSLPHDRFLVK